MKMIEEIIKYIKINGRNNYKSSIQENELNIDIAFNLITHKKQKEQNKETFVLWKNQLNQLVE